MSIPTSIPSPGRPEFSQHRFVNEGFLLCRNSSVNSRSSQKIPGLRHLILQRYESTRESVAELVTSVEACAFGISNRLTEIRAEPVVFVRSTDVGRSSARGRLLPDEVLQVGKRKALSAAYSRFDFVLCKSGSPAIQDDCRALLVLSLQINQNPAPERASRCQIHSGAGED